MVAFSSHSAHHLVRGRPNGKNQLPVEIQPVTIPSTIRVFSTALTWRLGLRVKHSKVRPITSLPVAPRGFEDR